MLYILAVFSPHRDPEAVDFVIVGAGLSGSVIANRLSEVTGWKILLLEAGGEPNILTEIPIAGPILFPTDYNCGTYAERQESFCSGSVINFMVYTRGNKMD
ncbi:unnamed protein product [Acanthoscelides obtectus]|uniref:Glucose-methanol-choline oxidoreductase N-terminal domain-containing protein n=1 Tax=Acanthoscelides obtectus TaxID=200917 RepID=A0A9P0L049_ACAOB|nr:unnamed protein product [Acanthoscelides obtectus]CAK1679667.1 Glucose dehydrogenase [FAD, quinone] [Acanthoscelides obtectus]